MNQKPTYEELEQRVQELESAESARKRVEEALVASEGKWRNVLANIPQIGISIDPHAKIIFANDYFLTLTGWKEQEVIGKDWFDRFIPENIRNEVRKMFSMLMHQKDSLGFSTHENDIVTRTGDLRNVAWSNVLTKDSQGNILNINCLGIDLTERKRAEQALRESEAKFRTLVEKSPLGIALIGDGGDVEYINPQFTNIFGYTIEDIPTGKSWFKKSYPDKKYRQQALKTWIEDSKRISVGEARPRIFSVTCKDGEQKKIYFRPVIMGSLYRFMIYEDITEKSRMEHQLQQARKFEAIGTLASGIAHDFNNLMMGIQGRASLMSVGLAPSHPHREHIKAIEACIRSATGLTRQLLGFARGGKYEVKSININELVRNSATMFSRTRKEIKIHTNIQPSPLVVEADRGQIEQVLLNMYVNAWQAMPDGGELYLETKAAMLDDDFCKPYAVEPGHYAKVSVTDTGIGMNEATRQQIFDPFFTTKEKGRGTGLGLASAYGIIKNHGGVITVYSERGRGTTFNIYLQLSEKEVHQEKATEGEILKGSETILLVDDEDIIIDVGQAMLKTLGYRVVISKSGPEAIEKVTDIGNEIDLVILDLIMPKMDGGKTFDRIREIRPKMPIMLSSGYAVNGQSSEIMRKGCNGFIQKPFNIAALSQKIRNVLGAR